MNEIISQDIEGIEDNDRHIKNGEGYQEDGGRSKHNNNKSRRICFNSKYKQKNDKCDEYCSNIRGPLISGSKQYGLMSISSPENAS